MSRSDGQMLWRAIDRLEKQEVAEFSHETTTIGRSNGIELVANAFYGWSMAAEPEDVGQAVMRIARKNTAAEKLLCAAKIAGVSSNMPAYSTAGNGNSRYL